MGKQYEYPMYLGEVPEEELWDIIKINVGAVTLMCRAFIEDMKSRGKGAIVNISSGSELQPLPLMNVYAASKVCCYVMGFNEIYSSKCICFVLIFSASTFCLSVRFLDLER